jgi:hypothetical protein
MKSRFGLIPGRILTLLLWTGIFYSSWALLLQLRGLSLPGNQQGYQPRQPIAFSHQLHAGELQISCLYCHWGAEKSKYAGIPAASLCMNCHRSVTTSWAAQRAEVEAAQQEKRPPRLVVSPELQKLYESLALDDQLRPDPRKQPAPIAWVRVHTLPAHACFDHRPHVKAGLACQVCHGPVETMTEVRQVETLSMGWCLACHRRRQQTAGQNQQGLLDCAVCHH